MRKTIILLLTLMSLVPALPAQRDTNVMWQRMLMENIRTLGNVSNVSVVEGRLYFFNAGILFSAPLGDAAVADAALDYASVDRGMNYLVECPGKGVYYTRRQGKRTQLCRVVDDGKGTRRGEPVRIARFKGNVVHPTFTPDGQIMVFSSDEAEGCRGGFDLWYAVADGDQWGDPVNLGAHINSPRHEFSPVIWGDYLFFSSNSGDSSDFDIYATRLVSTSSTHGDTVSAFPIGLAPVQRMPAPLNSASNDFGLAFAGKEAYFVSRPSPQSSDRIFKLKGTMHSVLYQGYVESLDGGPLAHARMRIYSSDGKHLLASAAADSMGFFKLWLPAGETFVVETSAIDHLSARESFEARPASAELLHSAWGYNVALRSFGLHRKHPLQAQGIFGSESGCDITAEGVALLADVVRFCKENPHRKLTLTAVYGRHKKDSYCTMLNRARLQALLQHFAKQGVPALDIETRSSVGVYQRTGSDNVVFDNVILFQFD